MASSQPRRDRPVRATLLPWRRPWIGEREIEDVKAVLKSGAIGMGPRTREFETRFAEYVGANHAVAVSSCWAALHLALETVIAEPGDEVITSVAVSPASAAAIDHLGGRPVLVDVHDETLTLDYEQAARRVTDRTRAIMPVHFAGVPCDMDPILALAARHDLTVIEDGIEALGAGYRGRMVGSIGDITVFGFTSDRMVTTGEGGMLTTDRDDYAARFRSRRQYGRAEPSGEVIEPGYGYAISDVAAAIGIQQLARIGMMQGIRSYYAMLYQLGLSDLPELVLPADQASAQHAWDLFMIQLDLPRLTIGRDQFIELLRQQNIEASVQFVPLYAHRYYRETFGYRPDDFPRALRASERAVSLPLYARMTEADVWDVIQAIRAIVTDHRLPGPRPPREQSIT